MKRLLLLLRSLTRKLMATVARWGKPTLVVPSPALECEPVAQATPELPAQPAPEAVEPPTVISLRPPPRAKWVKPKGLDLLERKPAKEKTDDAAEQKPQKPKEPKRPRVYVEEDDPEELGQFHFRDAILDQLDRYFVYLGRMKKGDRDSYDLLRQVGIQVMPGSAIKAFDHWRTEGELNELSAWWKTHRPSFGAVSYGLDAKTTALDNVELDDAGRDATRPDVGDHRHTVMLLSNKGGKDQKGIVWTPRFLYFRKYEIPPSTVQKAGDCDVYVLQVYWDRVDGRSKAFDKRHKGGVPQEYAVAVNRQTGLVRVLRMLQRERQKLAHKRGAERTSYIPNPRWEVPSKFLTWASLREDHAPDEYLRRLFIEAALMYETAALGSMIRVEVSQAKLAAVFGVEIKRTAYFFKDRDVTLNAGGTRRRIFHIVKPHRRMTKKGPKYVPMHFRGMKEFEWAGYKVKITVPGRDHIILPEFDVGLHDKEIPGVKYTGSDGLGRFLTTAIREGKGGTNAH